MMCGKCETIASIMSWCCGSIVPALEPQRRQKSESFFRGGVGLLAARLHQRFSNSSAKAQQGLTSGQSMAGYEMYALRHEGLI